MAETDAARDPVLAQVLADLEAECDDLHALVAPLDAAGWATPTPASGWTVATQIAHLAWTDDIAADAACHPDVFARRAGALLAAGGDPGQAVDRAAQEYLQAAQDQGDDLPARWHEARTRLARALAQVQPGVKLPWFGPPMSATSMATARLMETWAHGQDVADALGAVRTPTARLRHVARLAVRTRDFSFGVHGQPAPAEEFRVELTAPDGEVWTFGPPDAVQRVTGSALDLCLLAVQRRHRDDTDLVAEGVDAQAWLHVAQAFAGPPGAGRPAGRPS